MADSEAELTLVIQAKNLAAKTVDGFRTSVGGIATAAEKAAGKVGAAFTRLSSGITNGLGNLTENLASGAGLGDAMLQFGAFMAGQAAEGLIENLIEKMAGSSLVAAIGAPISAAGTAIGGVISAAIPIGMAALPALLLAALVAAVAFLIANPDIARNAAKIAGDIVGTIIGGLAGLAGKILGTIVSLPGAIANVVGGFVGSIVAWFLGIPGQLVNLGASIVTTIIGGLASFPGRLADVIRSAFADLRIDVGPFHISGRTGVTIDLPKINLPTGPIGGGFDKINVGHHAAGGWAGLHGPELAWLGEKGPEYVRRAGTGSGDDRSAAGVRIEGISERELVDMIDRKLYFRLRRAAPTSGRV